MLHQHLVGATLQPLVTLLKEKQVNLSVLLLMEQALIGSVMEHGAAQLLRSHHQRRWRNV